nr:ATP-binding protein [uncultured Winogradskyella sp.]
MSQILMNLVGNAAKFNENGTIWLTIKLNKKTSDGHCRLFFEVKDNGIGIPKDKQAVIFKEFAQIGNDNYSHKGSGLGLSIVKKLLKLHNSEISLESELGKGSSFSFELNLFENKNVEETCALAICLKDKKATEKAHILVDDNKINLKITERMPLRIV